MPAFDQCLEKVLAVEGGYENVPGDRGGETNFGITIATARAAGYQGAMRDLTRAEAAAIYRKLYWDALALDDVARAAPEVAAEVFDTAVNQGVNAAGLYLQQALNLLNLSGAEDLAADGRIGPATLVRLTDVAARPLDRRVLLLTLNSLQAERYLDICRRDPSQRKFFKGWMHKRVNLGA